MTESTTACPACNGTVSYAAHTCPHCGHPLDHAAVDAAGAVTGAAVRERALGSDHTWYMSHLFFVGRYVGAAIVPLLPVVWNLVVSMLAAAPESGEVATSSSAQIPTPYQWYAAGGLLVLFSLPMVLSAIITRLASSYTLTHDGYVRERRGLISRQTSEIHVSDIRLVNLKQGIWQRLFGVGSLFISSAGLSGVEVKFIGIPDPEGAKERILDRAETSDD